MVKADTGICARMKSDRRDIARSFVCVCLLQCVRTLTCNKAVFEFELQLELIDLQANDLLKAKHREGNLVEFYYGLPDVEFPKLKQFAAGMMSVCGTTYVCEQAFSKYVKSTHRTRLTDEHLKAILLIGCSNLKPKVDDILRVKKQFHKSH